ncbi:MAG: restriction endonuclease subunit S [Candidatus Thiodiazotropha endolucinida]
MSERQVESQELLGQVALIIDPHPSHRAPEEVIEGVPFAGIGDLNEAGKLLPGKGRTVPVKTLVEHALRYKLTSNTIGFGRVATIGKVVDFREIISDLTVSPTMAVIEPIAIDKGFLLAALQGEMVRKKIDQWLTGSTRSSLGIELLREIPLPRFEGQIQKTIGDIYRVLVTTIEKTEALIEKYQQIKAGLMHDLFTRGIGADGKLRPPREQAPDLYQQTSIGWIPKEWDIKPCSTLCSRICVGIVIKPAQYYVEEGIPAFRSANIREAGIDPSNLVYISSTSNQLLAKSQIKTGDILSVRTGYPGTSAVVPEDFDGANCIDILISTPGDRVLSEYLCNWINSSLGKGQVLRQQGGMAQQHFNVSEMNQLLVALPNLSEQSLISDRLQTCADRILAEEAKLKKLEKQKSGLLHDLLTGKVEVEADQPEAAHV